jgi:erythromycin esterase
MGFGNVPGLRRAPRHAPPRAGLAALAPAALVALALLASAGRAARDPAPARVETHQPTVVARPLPMPGDSAGPSAETRAASAWLTAHAHRLAFPDSVSDRSLAFLDTLVAGKRIVELGESTYGTGEFSRVKVRLIRYLHERLDFDLVAIESGFFECWRAYRTGDTLSAGTLLWHCASRTFATQEALELFRYVQATRHTGHPLVLAGFDVLPSGTATQEQSAFFGEAIGPVDGVFADQTQDWLLALAATQRAMRTAGERDAWLARERAHLVARYDSLADWLRAHAADLATAHLDDQEITKMAWRTAWCSARAYEMTSDAESPTRRALDRSEYMARNLEYQLDVVYPGRRVVVWANNSEVRLAPERAVPTATRNLGSWLAAERRADVLAVGAFMGSGQAVTLAGRPYTVAEPRPGSAEAIMAGAGARTLLVDLAHAPEIPATAWMRHATAAYAYGTDIESWVPREQYDALLFLDRVSPPRAAP